MTDIILEISRACITGAIFAYLWMTGKKENIGKQKGWHCILAGFALLLFGMIVDITDNFPSLNKYVFIGDTEYEALLEKLIGYLGGFIFLAIGFWKWLPTVISLKKAKVSLVKASNELELKVEERADEIIKLNDELTSEMLERMKVEEKFRTLFESSSDAIMLLDEKGFFDCNKSTLKMFACKSHDEFINMHPAELSPPTQPGGQDSREAADEQIAAAFRKGRNFFSWMHRRTDGEDFPAEVLLTSMKLQGKAVLQATVRDITERVELERQLVTEHEKFSKAFYASPYAMAMTICSEGRFVDINESFLELFEYSVDEVLGRTSLELGLYKDRADRSRLLNILDEQGRVQGFPVDLVRKSGEVRNCLMTFEMLMIHGIPHILSVTADLTDYISAEQEREKLIIDLEEAMSEVKTLSGLLPICSSCKKIRDDNGYWHQIELYIQSHSDAEFSHGICLDCAKEIYPDYYEKLKGLDTTGCNSKGNTG